MARRRPRELERTYSTRQFAAKLRRLARAVERGRAFTIQVAGETLRIPKNARFNVEYERYLRHQPSPPLECGYFDQAHLCREWTEFTGMSPGDFLARRAIESRRTTSPCQARGANPSETHLRFAGKLRWMGASGGSAIFAPSATAAVVRYQVEDVDRAIAFYAEHLGFHLKQRSGPVAIVSRGHLHLLLSGPASSGSRPMPDGRRQEPGGWNRIVLYVGGLDSTVSALRMAGARFRNEVEVGPGGKQIMLEDADGNPVELHEAPPQ
jgi:amphi-Trp domain-containing protein